MEKQAIEENRTIAPIRTDESFSKLWASFTLEQRKYAIQRMSTQTDKDAAEACSISYERVRHWKNKQEIDRALLLMADNTLDAAMDMARTVAARAMQVKIDAIEDKDIRQEVKQAAATELLDRVLGKPVQRVAPTNPQGTEQYSPHNAVSDERLLHLLELARERRLKALGEATITTVDTTAIDVTTTTEPPLEQG